MKITLTGADEQTDLDGLVREADWFSLDRAHAAVDAFEKWKAANGR